MTNKITNTTPLIYSCSGCSSAAQMANYLAIQLDRSGIAEMSCIAGVGGNVKKLVRTALSGRKIVTIDGCPVLACPGGVTAWRTRVTRPSAVVTVPTLSYKRATNLIT